MKRLMMLAALGVLTGSAALAQEPAVPPAAAPKPRPAGGIPGSAPLGQGPWDVSTEKGPLHVTVVARGLDHPWSLAFLPNGDMLVTERPGRLRLVRKGVLDPTPIAGVPDVLATGIGGLMDVTLHPKFAKNHLIYLAYSKPGAEIRDRSTLAVAQARWDGGATLGNVHDIFVGDNWYGEAPLPKRCCGQGPSSGSYGGRMAFDRAGFLYVTSGDRNYGERVQDPSNDYGKILRLRDDGSVPNDNPFVGKAGWKPEIYSTGHRNPLGLWFDPKSGTLWESEFGPRGGDEVNIIQRGRNYGWIDVTQGAHYNGEPAKGVKNVPGMEDPLLMFAPSINPGNLMIYQGSKFPGWKNDLLMGTMTRSVLRATFDAKGQPIGQERMLTELKQRFRDTKLGPDGNIYLLTDETDGSVLKVEPGK